MKKLLYLIRNIFMGIFVGIMLLLSPFIIALQLPFRFFSYRKSHFYRETGIPFRPGITDGETFRLYELIRANHLPIRYLIPKDPKQACAGFFLTGTTLLIHDLPGIFHEPELGWTAYPEEREPLTDTVANTLLRLRTDYPAEIVTDVRILAAFTEEFPEDRARTEQEPLFLVYGSQDELAALLRNA